MNYLTKKSFYFWFYWIRKRVVNLFSKNGYHVLIHGRNQKKLNYLYDEIMSLKGTSTIINLDLNDHNGIDRLGYKVFEKYKKLDLLVMNAAILGTLTPLCHQEPKNSKKFKYKFNCKF